MVKKCVYCEKTDTLNTQFSVKLEDGTQVTVDICDEHAEEATVKSAREAYQANQDKITEVMALAKSLGLNVTEDKGSGIAIATQAPVETPAAMTPQTIRPVETAETSSINPVGGVTEKEREAGWVDASMVDGQKGMQSVGKASAGVESRSSHVVSGQKDVLPSDARRGKVQMQLVEGRGGQPLAMPQKRVDGTGTTRFNVAQKEDDNSMQKRFKGVAETSRSSFDNAAGPDFRNGYKDTQHNCPICRGDCVVNGEDCPKCDGMGFITIY